MWKKSSLLVGCISGLTALLAIVIAGTEPSLRTVSSEQFLVDQVLDQSEDVETQLCYSPASTRAAFGTDEHVPSNCVH